MNKIEIIEKILNNDNIKNKLMQYKKSRENNYKQNLTFISNNIKEIYKKIPLKFENLEFYIIMSSYTDVIIALENNNEIKLSFDFCNEMYFYYIKNNKIGVYYIDIMLKFMKKCNMSLSDEVITHIYNNIDNESMFLFYEVIEHVQNK